nr:hypothetical protein [Methanosarcina barkeri]
MDCNTPNKKLSTPIKAAKITTGMSVDDLVREYKGCAFGAGRLAEAVEIYYEMLASEKNYEIFRACRCHDSRRHEKHCCGFNTRRLHRCACHDRS